MSAPDSGTGEDRAGTAHADAERAACTPCRGTGKVISNLGGESHEMACPWCEGSGKFIPEHDAQDVQGERATS